MADGRTLLSDWGRTAPSAARVMVPASAADVASIVRSAPARGVVARGLGRSYGDAAQNAGGMVLDMRQLNSLGAIDPVSGSITCGAGASLDALGAPQSVLVLGATSDIAAATLAKLAGLGRLRRAVLAARRSAGLDYAASRVRGLGVADVSTATFDAREPQSVSRVVSEAFAGGDVDIVVVAFGVLPDQQDALQHLEVALDNAQVNDVGALAACLAAADALRCQGHGTLVVLSSVAAERRRRSNFVYGSAKAGLDALATGLGDELCGSGASVIVVRPGFVKTKMTAGLRPAPLSTTPEAVAAAISGAPRRRTATVWVPGPLRYVMATLRHVPRTLFRRLPL